MVSGEEISSSSSENSVVPDNAVEVVQFLSLQQSLFLRYESRMGLYSSYSYTRTNRPCHDVLQL